MFLATRLLLYPICLYNSSQIIGASNSIQHLTQSSSPSPLAATPAEINQKKWNSQAKLTSTCLSIVELAQKYERMEADSVSHEDITSLEAIATRLLRELYDHVNQQALYAVQQY